MKLTHTPTINNTKASLNASFRQHLLAFVDRHADTFDALARNTGPLSTSWLPIEHNRVNDESGGRTWPSADPVAHQKTDLPQWIAQLAD